jgi:hypothetical protein
MTTFAFTNAATIFAAYLKELIERKGYLPEPVFNYDETESFWKRMPYRTYIHKQQSRQKSSSRGRTD